MSEHLVFVYGSLKRHFGNNGLMAQAKFLGITDTVKSDYRMYSLGAFPAVVESCIGGAYTITGELYSIDDSTLNRLDMLEGNGSMYIRKLIPVYYNLKTVEAWVYLMPEVDMFVDRFISDHFSNKFVYTDCNLGTQEWCQE